MDQSVNVSGDRNQVTAHNRPGPTGPTLGRIVRYVLTPGDVQAILLEHGDPPRGMNPPRGGDVAPAIVVRVFSDSMLNLQVLLDGPGAYWATSRPFGADEAMGTWHWPARR